MRGARQAAQRASEPDGGVCASVRGGLWWPRVPWSRRRAQGQQKRTIRSARGGGPHDRARRLASPCAGSQTDGAFRGVPLRRGNTSGVTYKLYVTDGGLGWERGRHARLDA